MALQMRKLPCLRTTHPRYAVWTTLRIIESHTQHELELSTALRKEPLDDPTETLLSLLMSYVAWLPSRRSSRLALSSRSAFLRTWQPHRFPRTHKSTSERLASLH
jgi:hypothetical protein